MLVIILLELLSFGRLAHNFFQEYIHYQGYIHNDIKAQNILTGYGKKEENDVFVVDFGLVTKYMKNEKHVVMLILFPHFSCFSSNVWFLYI